MKKIFLSLTCCSIALLSACDARADRFPNRDNVYISGNLGYSAPNDSDIDFGLGSGSVELDSGWVGSVAVGSQLDQRFRMEGEFSHQSNDIGDGDTGGTASTFGQGDISVNTYMVNAIFDIPLNPAKTSIKPYVSVGIGIADVSVDTGDNTTLAVDDSDIVLAYQLGAGVSYPLSRSLAVTTGYRFLGTETGNFKASSTAFGFTGGTDVSYHAHEVTAGMRYYF